MATTEQEISARNVDRNASAEVVQEIELSRIMGSPNNPRRHFDQAKLEELAESIKADGVQQPIIVRPIGREHFVINEGKQSGKPGWFVDDLRDFLDDPSEPSGKRLTEAAKIRGPLSLFFETQDDAELGVPQFEIVMGERRYRASIIAGKETIPAIVRDATDECSQLLRALVENIQRDDLNPMEEALALERLVGMGMANKDLAHQLGRSESALSNRRRLAGLPQHMQQAIADGKISPAHGLAILQWEDHPAVMEVAFKKAPELPSKDLEKVERWYQSIKSAKAGIELDYSMKFDRQECEGCKDACRPNTWRLMCLRPECAKQKQKVYERELQERIESQSADGVIPYHDIPSPNEIDPAFAGCETCEKSCVASLDHWEKPRRVCRDPACYRGLREAAAEAKRTERDAEFAVVEARLRSILTETPVEQLAGGLLFRIIGEPDVDVQGIEAMVEMRGIEGLPDGLFARDPEAGDDEDDAYANDLWDDIIPAVCDIDTLTAVVVIGGAALLSKLDMAKSYGGCYADDVQAFLDQPDWAQGSHTEAEPVDEREVCDEAVIRLKLSETIGQGDVITSDACPGHYVVLTVDGAREKVRFVLDGLSAEEAKDKIIELDFSDIDEFWRLVPDDQLPRVITTDITPEIAEQLGQPDDVAGDEPETGTVTTDGSPAADEQLDQAMEKGRRLGDDDPCLLCKRATDYLDHCEGCEDHDKFEPIEQLAPSGTDWAQGLVAPKCPCCGAENARSLPLEKTEGLPRWECVDCQHSWLAEIPAKQVQGRRPARKNRDVDYIHPEYGEIRLRETQRKGATFYVAYYTKCGGHGCGEIKGDAFFPALSSWTDYEEHMEDLAASGVISIKER